MHILGFGCHFQKYFFDAAETWKRELSAAVVTQFGLRDRDDVSVAGYLEKARPAPMCSNPVEVCHWY